MTLINKGMFSSNTDEWATPQSLFDVLNKEFDFARMCSSNGCDFGRECPAKGFCPIGYKFTKDMAAELNDIPIQTHADNFVSKMSNWINTRENNDKHKDKNVLVSENDSHSRSCEHCLRRKVFEYYENMSAMGKCHLFDVEV